LLRKPPKLILLPIIGYILNRYATFTPAIKHWKGELVGTREILRPRYASLGTARVLPSIYILMLLVILLRDYIRY